MRFPLPVARIVKQNWIKTMYKNYFIVVTMLIFCSFSMIALENSPGISRVGGAQIEKLVQNAVKKAIDNEKPYLPVRFFNKATSSFNTVISLGVIASVLYVYWRWPKEADLQKFEENLSNNASEAIEEICKVQDECRNTLVAHRMSLEATLNYFNQTIIPGTLYLKCLGRQTNENAQMALEEERKNSEAIGDLHQSINGFFTELDEGKQEVLTHADAAERAVREHLSRSMPLPPQQANRSRSLTRTSSATVGPVNRLQLRDCK